MIVLGLISFVCGAALAARYQFLVLGVATFFGLAGIALYAHAANLTAMNGLLASLLFAICLQTGYLAGALVLDLLTTAKVPVPVQAQRRWR